MILTKITTLEFSVAKRTCKASPELKLILVIRGWATERSESAAPPLAFGFGRQGF